ncbi:hypothetical protein SDC9_48335 [bioreactor metagenome]|uniref:Uncharacterized protein n=1 Tax=bioreactor metagenome TaxID=1076179 RepID=A0A644WE43_9ZZZZ
MTCSFLSTRLDTLLWDSDETDPRCIRFKELLQQQIERLIKVTDVRYFIISMNFVADLYAAEIILKLRHTFPIFLECALHHESSTKNWSVRDQNMYNTILENADVVKTIIPECNIMFYITQRKYIFDSGDIVIAMQKNYKREGDGLIISSASKRKAIIVLNPDVLTVEDYFSLADLPNAIKIYDKVNGEMKEIKVTTTSAKAEQKCRKSKLNSKL